MTRRHDWLQRLWEEVDRWRGEPFVYGQHDCCLFAARCADAILEDSTFVEQLQRQYQDEAGAMRFIARHRGLRPAVETFLGAPFEGYARARRGDVCLVPTERGDGLGVCVGATIAVAGSDFYPLTAAKAVWCIG